MNAMEIIFEQDPSEANRRFLCLAQKHLHEKLKMEEIYCKQKANVKWLKEGDNNTRFLHNLRKRQQKLYIHRIKDSTGRWLTHKEEIKNEVVKFF